MSLYVANMDTSIHEQEYTTKLLIESPIQDNS